MKFGRDGGAGANRELWVSVRLVKWMNTDPEYLQAKEELKQATNDYSIYVKLKEEWEKENLDILNAERIRSKRAELMQADPETLKALGITPDPCFTTPEVATGSSSGADNGWFHLEQGYVDALIRARASEMIAEQKKASEG